MARQEAIGLIAAGLLVVPACGGDQGKTQTFAVACSRDTGQELYSQSGILKFTCNNSPLDSGDAKDTAEVDGVSQGKVSKVTAQNGSRMVRSGAIDYGKSRTLPSPSNSDCSLTIYNTGIIPSVSRNCVGRVNTTTAREAYRFSQTANRNFPPQRVRG